jgi:hypothetical protein
MAIVPDLSGNVPASVIGNGPTDRDYARASFNRTNAGDPNGVLTPLYIGEVVFDTTNRTLLYALRSDNASWVASSIEV